jgi:hypothetical protein
MKPIAACFLLLLLARPAAAAPLLPQENNYFFAFDGFEATTAHELPCPPGLVRQGLVTLCMTAILNTFETIDYPSSTETSMSVHFFSDTPLLTIPRTPIDPAFVQLAAVGMGTIEELWTGEEYVSDVVVSTFGNLTIEAIRIAVVLTNPTQNGPRYVAQTKGWGPVPTRVPEASTLALFVCGLITITLSHRRTRRCRTCPIEVDAQVSSKR